MASILIEFMLSFIDNEKEVPLPMIVYSPTSPELEEEEVTLPTVEEVMPSTLYDPSPTVIVAGELGNLETREEMANSKRARGIRKA